MLIRNKMAMIEKGKFYLCIRDRVDEIIENEVKNDNFNNTFIESLFLRNFLEVSPLFLVGSIYCSPYDGYLNDSINRRVKVDSLMERRFLEIGIHYSNMVSYIINSFKKKGLLLEIIPIGKLKDEVHNQVITKSDITIRFKTQLVYRSNKYINFSTGEGETPEESIANAWKTLRVKSAPIKQIVKCLRNGVDCLNAIPF